MQTIGQDSEFKSAQEIVREWLGVDGQVWVPHIGSPQALNLIHRIAAALKAGNEPVDIERRQRPENTPDAYDQMIGSVQATRGEK